MVLPTIRPRNLWNLCSNLYKRWFALDFCPNYCVILISYSINVRGNWRQCYGSALQYVEDQVPVIQLSLRKGAFYSSLQTLPYQWLNIICMLRDQLGKLNKQIVLTLVFHILSRVQQMLQSRLVPEHWQEVRRIRYICNFRKFRFDFPNKVNSD